MLETRLSIKLILAGSLFGVATAALVSPSTESHALSDYNYAEFTDTAATDTPSLLLGDESPLPTEDIQPVLPEFRTETLKVSSGDTLDKILARAGVSRPVAYQAVKSLSEVFDPRRLRPGQKITVSFRTSPKENEEPFHAITIEPKLGQYMTAECTDDGSFKSYEKADVFESRLVRYEGEIRNSLLSSAAEKGVPKNIVHAFARIFSNSIDFSRDIRSGDRFKVMFEQEVSPDGKHIRNSNVLYASLTTRGDTTNYYRFTDDAGFTDYYDESGESAKKSLSRRPVPNARISSPFGLRPHPIFRYKRMHWGIDYAAPRGTPIHAAGDGVVEHVGRKGAYGKFVRIRHNTEYQTAYAHMRGYARGLRVGKRVKKGDVIGYVGNTGRSTGPHLHYEIVKSGKRVNPLKVKIASGRQLKGRELKKFDMAKNQLTTTYIAMTADSVMKNRPHLVANLEVNR